MHKSTTTKIIFLFLFLSFLFVPIVFVSATQIANPTFTAYHLDVIIGDFEGVNTWGSSKQIRYYTGGEDLLEFNNMGQQSYDPVANQILYKAQAKLGFEIIVYSTVSPIDVCPDFSVNQYTQENYLWVYKFLDTWYDPNCNIPKIYTVNYYAVNFGIVNTHRYSGYFPIEIGVKNTVGFGGELTLGDYTFEMPALEYDVMNVQIMTFEHDKIGTHDNEFINYNPTNEGRLSIVSVTDQTADKAIMDYINNEAHIGWEMGYLTGPITMQNYNVDGNLIETDELNKYKLNILLQPEITETRQINTITKASVWWDYRDDWLLFWNWSPAGMGFHWGPTTSDFPRTVAVNVNNRMMHFDMEVLMDLYMTVQPDHILSQSELQDPFFEQGDWVWDTTFQGDVPTLAEDTSTLDIFGLSSIWTWFIIIGVLVVVVYLFIKIGMPLIISRRTKRGK